MDLNQCTTPKQIERVFQRVIKATPGENHFKLRQACNQQAIEIAPLTRRGNLLAIRKDKRQGCSRRYTVDGKLYHTGTWFNGAGFAYAMYGFRQWYDKLLRAGGLRSKRKIELIISWAEDDYLWRSLEYLA